MKKILPLLAVLCLACTLSFGAEAPALLRGPSVGASQIVFGYGNEIWSVAREGGVGRGPTTGSGPISRPFLSPARQLIDYTGRLQGHTDVSLIPPPAAIPLR